MFEELLRQTSSFQVAGEVERSHWPRYGVTTPPLKSLARTVKYRFPALFR